jgi:glycosyltransferase involved in cell wall biosynthesis
VRLRRFDAPVASPNEQLRWRRELRSIDADVLLVPYHLACPGRSPTPVVAVLHDCIIESDAAFAPSRHVRLLYRTATRRALRRASEVVTISEATRASAREFHGLEISPRNVIPVGVDRRFSQRCPPAALAVATAELRLPDRYILHVAVRRPHKNHETLLRAFALLASAEPDVGLVLVGQADRRFPDPVPRLVRELGIDHRTRLIDHVPEDRLPALYQGAAIFAFPSLVEGFGLPLVEAMAAGAPVVASDTPALAEVARDSALMVGPRDVPAWATALRRLLRDVELAERLRRRGAETAAGYEWSLAGRRMAELLWSVARRSRVVAR